MAETVGLLILSAAGVTDSFIGIGTASALSVAGVTVSISTAATIVGAAAITAASIGLQYALSSNPNVPKPEAGAQPLKQSVPPRVRGYWINRLSGSYLLFLAAGGDSQDVLAFHSGRIEQAMQLYMHDTPVSTTNGLGHGQYTVVVSPSGIYYQNVNLQVFYGTDTQNVCDTSVNAFTTSGVWTTAFAAKGIACIAMDCGHASDPSQFTKIYPQGLPLPSVVAKCAPVWDPRDPAQSRADKSTWRASPNPVLQLIDYLTEPDGGMGLPLDEILPPAVLAQWMVEASLCDGRYSSAGWYQFDNSPDSVIGKILSTCDGWLSEAGDGTLSLTVGVYRTPTDIPIAERHILGFNVQYGSADESTVNQLDVTYTNPAAGYVTDQIDSVRDEDDISLTGIVRSRQLDLTWVQDPWQANVLAQRGLLRLNPGMSGTLVTTLYGLNYVGKRWVPIQFPLVKGMEDCVVEIQDKAEIDLLGGKVTFTWNIIDVAALSALGATQPAEVREDNSYYRREDNSIYVREH